MRPEEVKAKNPLDVSTIKDIDPEVVPLCNALNRMKGVRTFESCCGHGNRVFVIWFTVSSMITLGRLAFGLYGSHSSHEASWTIWVDQPTDGRTDFQPTFCFQSQSFGKAAYKQVNEIAEMLEDWIKRGCP